VQAQVFNIFTIELKPTVDVLFEDSKIRLTTLFAAEHGSFYFLF
jgi:uncharacterized protein YbbC (DUF1343 family)